MKAGRQQPYAHIISYLLDRTIVQHLQNPVRHPLEESPTFYKVYNPLSSRDPRHGQRALLAAQSELSPEEREATQWEDDAIEDLDAINGFWDGDYGSDSSDSDYTVTTPPPRANDAEVGGSSSAQPDPAAAQAPVSPAAPTTTDLMQMMINMQTQFNDRMLKLQEEAAAREERNMTVIHAIQQQQERTKQAMARDRESAALMFERLWQRTGTEPLTVQPSLAISPPSAHLLLLPEQLPLQPDTFDTLRAQPITQLVSTTPFPPIPG